MRLIAIAIVLFIGALLVTAGAYLQADPNCHMWGVPLFLGVVITVGSFCLFLIEWWPVPVSRDVRSTAPAASKAAFA